MASLAAASAALPVAHAARRHRRAAAASTTATTATTATIATVTPSLKGRAPSHPHQHRRRGARALTLTRAIQEPEPTAADTAEDAPVEPEVGASGAELIVIVLQRRAGAGGIPRQETA